MIALFSFVDTWRWESEDGMANDIGWCIDKIMQSIIWSWSQMTLLSGLILVMILAMIGLAWLILSDRKKGYSRAYWRGRKDENKIWDNSYAHPEEENRK